MPLMPSVYVWKLVVLCTETFRVITVCMALWLSADDSTSIMGVSNPGYGEYTIYAEMQLLRAIMALSVHLDEQGYAL